VKTRDLPDKLYGFDTEEILESLFLPVRFHSSKATDLTDLKIRSDVFPLIEEFAKKLRQKLDHRPSNLYRLATGSFIPYRIMPECLRSKLMRARTKVRDLSLEGKIGLEEIRKKFLDVLCLKETNVSNNICFITHDIESEKGMKRALRLKKIEEKYDVKSTWFLLTEEYKLNGNDLKRLAENGEVASHGTRHDGRLLTLRKQIIVEELKRSKQKLEETIEKEIYGFRAPLLQYNDKLLQAVSEAGFKYDSSMPTWEPIHPLTMRQDGIELINPIKICGIIEMPVTFPQDYQMLHILKLTPKETVKRWLEMMNQMEKLMGISTILIHPDYEYANEENLQYYDDLLKHIIDTQTILTSFDKNHNIDDNKDTNVRIVKQII
jgi:peptidoglycan/xylan/chitin deacetylase (PgdA/CDA1 family)